jgi:hypothetical protein
MIRPARLAAPLAALLLVAAPALAQDAETLKKRADLLFEDARKSGATVAWEGLAAGTGPESLVITKVKFTGSDKKTIAIEKIDVRVFDWANPKAARYADLSVLGVVVPVEPEAAPAGPDAPPTLRDLGYEKLTIDFHLDYKFDADKKELNIAKLDVDIDDLGDFAFTLRLGGLSPAELSGLAAPGAPKAEPKPGEDPMAAIGKIMLVKASIAFEDHSIIERAIKAYAKRKNMSPEQAMAEVLKQLQEGAGPNPDAGSKEMMEKIAQFLKKPGTIEIVIAPQQPVPLMAALFGLASPEGMKALGVSVHVK